MSYTPINWQTGDIITAEKMNKMDNGWSVESSSQQLFSETVTTELDPEYPDEPAYGVLSYASFISADTIIVTFNGTDYTCSKYMFGDSECWYGGYGEDGFDFTAYPFAIGSFGDENSLSTEAGGTYSISVVASVERIEISAKFSDACNSCVDTSTMPILCVSGVTQFSEMSQAMMNEKRMLYFFDETHCYFISRVAINSVLFYPPDNTITVSFVDGVFTVTPYGN